MKVRLAVTLFWYKPPCFSYANDAVLMLISRNIHKKSNEVSIRTRSPPASFSFKGQATKNTTVKWSIMAKGETERGNGKQARETIFYLNRFTSHRAAKTWGNRKLFYSKLFSSTICSVSNDSKWFTSDSFVFLFIRNDPYSKSTRRLTTTLRFRVHSVEIIIRKKYPFSWTRLAKDLRNLR